jgi:hypothetical protein
MRRISPVPIRFLCLGQKSATAAGNSLFYTLELLPLRLQEEGPEIHCRESASSHRAKSFRGNIHPFEETASRLRPKCLRHLDFHRAAYNPNKDIAEKDR